VPGNHSIAFHDTERSPIYSAGRPNLARIADARVVADFLKSIRFLDLAPDAMRTPSTPGEQALGDRGENLSTVLNNLTADAAKKQLATIEREAAQFLGAEDRFFAENAWQEVEVWALAGLTLPRSWARGLPLIGDLRGRAIR